MLKQNLKKTLSATLVFASIFVLLPVMQISMLTSNVFASTVNYPVAGGELKFDTATGSITGYTGSPTSVVIPSAISGYSVTSIGNNAFSHCSSLTAINVDTNNPNYSSDGVALFDRTKTAIIKRLISNV